MSAWSCPRNADHSITSAGRWAHTAHARTGTGHVTATHLNDYAATASQVEQWQPLVKELQERLPRLLLFGGRDESPDAAVRTALNSCYETYLEDETLQGRVREIEAEVTQHLEKEADSLCQHIRRHCGEFVRVLVKPEVSFKGGFKRAPLEASKADGEPVDLTRSGQGSNRRIALAVWEWTSNLLESSELTAGERGEQEPTQTIVVYDEPDTHLDYRHQRTVMDIIRKQCALPHVSVVVATPSMNLIDGVDIADVVHLRLGEGVRTIVERLADESHDGVDFHLGQIAAAVGLRNSVLLHERCFLAVEGPTEQQCLPMLFRLSQGLSLQAAGIALWACGNNEGTLHLAGYLIKNRRTVMSTPTAAPISTSRPNGSSGPASTWSPRSPTSVKPTDSTNLRNCSPMRSGPRPLTPTGLGPRTHSGPPSTSPHTAAGSSAAAF
ncbi:ATP-dependent endonuclease [Streptomyces sp. NPDC014793]|uniref:ATP-dependent nuclease n=1 Tax=Streptomyces sp. NPDC014793 TaxID=3364914 RepID=UPI0036FBDD71